MSFSNSPLISATCLSPNHSGARKYPISRISIHCVVGQCTVQNLGAWFARASTKASANYGIGYDGNIGLYVPESSASWCTSNSDNDNRAVTIEVASDTKAPYAVKDAAYKALLKLVEDICRRNGKKRVTWIENKARALAYSPAGDEIILTPHRWFAAKACPGDYLFSRHSAIAEEITRRLGASAAPAAPSTGDQTVASGECSITLPLLRKGSRGGHVRTLQVLLNKDVAAGLREDGDFGPATERTVIAYQLACSLSADGIVGANTWSQLLK